MFAVLCAAGASCGGFGPADGPPWTPQGAAPVPATVVLVHEDEGALSIVNTAENRLEGTIAVAARFGAVALDADAELIAAAVPGGIAVIDVPSRKILRTLPFTAEPSGLAIAGDFVYVINDEEAKGRVSALSLADGKVTATQATWGLGDRIVVSADGRRLFVPHHYYSGFVTVLDASTLKERASIRFEDGARQPALSPDERWLLVPNGTTSSGRVTIVDTATNRIAADVTLTGHPMDVAISPDGRYAFAPQFGDHSVAVIDVDKRTVERTIRVSDYPTRLAVTPDGTRLFAVHNGTNRLTIVDVAKGTAELRELDKTVIDIVRPGRRAAGK